MTLGTCRMVVCGCFRTLDACPRLPLLSCCTSSGVQLVVQPTCNTKPIKTTINHKQTHNYGRGVFRTRTTKNPATSTRQRGKCGDGGNRTYTRQYQRIKTLPKSPVHKPSHSVAFRRVSSRFIAPISKRALSTARLRSTTVNQCYPPSLPVKGCFEPATAHKR